jgi:hypothetical protein
MAAVTKSRSASAAAKSNKASSRPVAAASGTQDAARAADAQALFERMTGPLNDEAFHRCVLLVLKRIEGDLPFALQLSGLIAANEYPWLSIMQRVFNSPDSTKYNAAAELTDIICEMVKATEDRTTHQLFISSKLSCVLTADKSQCMEKIVKVVLICLQTPSDIDLFLGKMQGVENVATCMSSCDYHAACRLVATLLARHNGCAADLVRHDIDTAMLRRAFQLIKNRDGGSAAHKERVSATAHFILYALRFFARLRVNSFVFVERCFNLCAQIASYLPAPSAELAADICSITTDFAFVAQRHAIWTNFIACTPHWRAIARPQPLMQFIAKSIAAAPKETVQKLAAPALVAAMRLLPDRADVAVMTAYLYILQFNLRCLPPHYVANYLNFRQLQRVKKNILQLDAAARGDVLTRLLQVIFTFATRFPCPGLTHVFESFSALHASGVMSSEMYQAVSGAAYDATSVAEFDERVAGTLEAACTALTELEQQEKAYRQERDDGVGAVEKVARASLATCEAGDKQGLRGTQHERLFAATVLPACEYINERREAAAAEMATTEGALTTLRLLQAAGSRHKTQNNVMTSKFGGRATSEDDQAKEQLESLQLHCFQRVEGVFVSRLQVWQTHQKACMARALVSNYDHARASGAEVLTRLELTEQNERGEGWHGMATSTSTAFTPVCAAEATAWRSLLRCFRDPNATEDATEDAPKPAVGLSVSSLMLDSAELPRLVLLDEEMTERAALHVAALRGVGLQLAELHEAAGRHAATLERLQLMELLSFGAAHPEVPIAF